MDIYTINDYINEKTNTINNYKAIIKAIENIEIVTKKDGSPFKNLSKNFKNCSITAGFIYSEQYLTIHYIFNGCQSVNINIMPTVHEYKRPFNISADIISQQYVKDVYKLTVSDIKNELQYQIDLYQHYISIEQQQIKYFKSNLKKLNNYIDKINMILKNSDIKTESDTYSHKDYTLQYYTKNNIPTRDYPYDNVILIKDF